MSMPLRPVVLLLCLIAALASGGCQRRGSSAVAPVRPQPTIQHMVQVGETISMIAARYGVSVNTIVDANDLRSRDLKAGRMLLVPGGRMPEPEVAAPAPAPVVAKPEVDRSWFIPRSEWARQPVVVSRTKPMGGTPMRITVHHSGDKDDTRFNSLDWLRRIDLNHIKGVGHPEPWACIGYHFIIDADGRVYEGRPLKYQGAHAGFDEVNRLNIGVCLIGEFENNRVPATQRTALLSVLDRLCLGYSINRSSVFGHKHFRVTECPGRFLSAIINAYADRGEAPADADRRQVALPSGATRLGAILPTTR
jgi:LysM repeat protein